MKVIYVGRVLIVFMDIFVNVLFIIIILFIFGIILMLMFWVIGNLLCIRKFRNFWLVMMIIIYVFLM